jgi:hypothetical protein
LHDERIETQNVFCNKTTVENHGNGTVQCFNAVKYSNYFFSIHPSIHPSIIYFLQDYLDRLIAWT